jgi:hypothetical protein
MLALVIPWGGAVHGRRLWGRRVRVGAHALRQGRRSTRTKRSLATAGIRRSWLHHHGRGGRWSQRPLGLCTSGRHCSARHRDFKLAVLRRRSAAACCAVVPMLPRMRASAPNRARQVQ